MESDQLQGLASQVGIVFHVAAQLSYKAEYARLEQANVSGTEKVIEFCASGGLLRRLCHISSVAVLTPQMADQQGLINDTAPLGNISRLPAFGSCDYSTGECAVMCLQADDSSQLVYAAH